MARKKKPAELDIQDSYSGSMQDVLVMLELIGLELDNHEKRFEKNHTNWQFVGDLTDVRKKLKELLVFLSALPPEDVEQTVKEFKG